MGNAVTLTSLSEALTGTGLSAQVCTVKQRPGLSNGKTNCVQS